jgi:YidC/Oxa1 family membrane protein insertase
MGELYMDRNLILAIVISIVIIVGFQFLFQAYAPPPPKKPTEATEAVKKPNAGTPAEHQTAGQPEKKTPPVNEPRVVRPVQPTTTPAVEEVRITVDTPKYEAVVSSKGGRIISFKLKDYKVSRASDQLENLFEPGGPDTAGPSIMFTRRDETFNDDALGYTPDTQSATISLDKQSGEKSLTFQATTAAGLTINKTFRFHSDSYAIDFSLTLTNNSDEDRNYLITFPWRKVYRGEDGSQRFSWNSAEILIDHTLKDYFFKDIKGDEEPSGAVEWAGLGDVYFFKALVFGKTPATKVTLFKPSKEEFAEIWVRYGAVDLPKGKPVETQLMMYLGPKERQPLLAAGHDLSKALFYSNYRLLEVMSEYLLVFLRLCYSGFTLFGIGIPGTGNYGVNIILLTVIIKILFIPLSHKSMKSMKRMQDLQPQIAKLKEKFKDDKTALNKATMELFREQKVSPLGGCWPMFLQFPVFIALYQALSYAIELRQAPFICIPSIYLCINDLSAPDPYYVTPILMGVTMVLQQWMTPSAGDPTQKKMMMLMPVVFTWLFLNFPSGLVLYWLVNNVLSIAQQMITNRMAT